MFQWRDYLSSEIYKESMSFYNFWKEFLKECKYPNTEIAATTKIYILSKTNSLVE
jgi:hypothetical protein